MIKHIAFIMDGNRRYAKKNNFEKKEGYKAGIQQFKNFVRYQIEENIYETSFWALSTENWKNRELSDLKPLYDLLNDFFKKGDEIEEFFYENKIELNIIGDLEEFETENRFISNEKRKIFLDLKNRVEKHNNKLGNEFKFKVNLCINYGGQREILNAFKNIFKKIKNNELKAEKITEKIIKENIYFSNSPAPEIIVRPGNAPRLSGFMSWDCAYSEIYLEEKFWPELTKEDFLKYLNWFENIQRNFGK